MAFALARLLRAWRYSPTSWGKVLKRWFPGLEATEVEQILVRAIYLVFGWSYILWIDDWRPLYLYVLAAQLPAMVAHTLHARFRPAEPMLRRHAGVLIDLLPCLAVVAQGSPHFAPLFFVMSTISVGYGLRFGPHYTVLCALVNGIGLAVITLTVPAFQAEWGWMLSTIALVSIVPLYSAYLTVRLSEQRARALEDAALLRHESTHDQLTGLANRGHLLDVLAVGLQQAAGRRSRIAVLFIDLDGFKNVNDRFGHAAGDALLRRVANCLKESVRSRDLVARVGGDEFVVLLDEFLQDDEVQHVARTFEDRLRAAMAAEETFVGVGASIGTATYSGGLPCPSADGLIAQADAAMYRVKSVHHAKAGARARSPRALGDDPDPMALKAVGAAVGQGMA